jgi:hypothetical protein
LGEPQYFANVVRSAPATLVRARRTGEISRRLSCVLIVLVGDLEEAWTRNGAAPRIPRSCLSVTGCRLWRSAYPGSGHDHTENRSRLGGGSTDRVPDRRHRPRLSAACVRSDRRGRLRSNCRKPEGLAACARSGCRGDRSSWPRILFPFLVRLLAYQHQGEAKHLFAHAEMYPEVRRIHLLGRTVNKGQKRGRRFYGAGPRLR